MLNACPACGLYRADKVVSADPEGVVCPECGALFPFLLQPLCILSGASGTGKSTICRMLTGPDFPAVVLDSDILWSDDYAPKAKWPDYFNLWLRNCKNIGQSGKPVLLGGGGFGVPDNLTQCVEFRYFRSLHIAALVCEESELKGRLSARPEWRGSSDADGLEAQVAFNRWFLNAAGSNSQTSVFDTTSAAPAATSVQVRTWLEAILATP